MRRLGDGFGLSGQILLCLIDSLLYKGRKRGFVN